jgi:hypothetical protein
MTGLDRLARRVGERRPDRGASFRFAQPVRHGSLDQSRLGFIGCNPCVTELAGRVEQLRIACSFRRAALEVFERSPGQGRA